MPSLRCYCQLSINATDVEGEPDVTTIGGDDVSTWIHIRDFELTGKVDYDTETGIPGSTRVFPPLKIRKAVDKTTPLLIQAFCGTQPITATFAFYRPFTDQAAESGGGEDGMQLYFTITGTLGRVVAFRQGKESPFGKGSDQDYQLPIEDIELTFGTLSWDHKIANVEHSHTWREP